MLLDGITSAESTLSKCELLNSYFTNSLTRSSQSIPTPPSLIRHPTTSSDSCTEEALHLLLTVPEKIAYGPDGSMLKDTSMYLCHQAQFLMGGNIPTSHQFINPAVIHY